MSPLANGDSASFPETEEELFRAPLSSPLERALLFFFAISTERGRRRFVCVCYVSNRELSPLSNHTLCLGLNKKDVFIFLSPTTFLKTPSHFVVRGAASRLDTTRGGIIQGQIEHVSSCFDWFVFWERCFFLGAHAAKVAETDSTLVKMIGATFLGA